MKWLTCIFLGLSLAIIASAADIAGTWKASFETPNGTVESTFTFKVDGAKLTGTVDNGQMGKSDLSEGKVDGDIVSFAVVRQFNGNEFRINYKGKVSGNEMKLTLSFPTMDQTFEITAKKTS